MATDPNTAAARWSQNLAGSTEKIKEGINNVSVAPGTAAAAQKQVWLANVQAAQDKWSRNTAAVTKEEWQAAMLDKGLNRIGPGAQAAQSKFANFLGQFLPHVENVRRSLPPRGTLEQNIARSAAMIRGVAKFDYRK